MRLRQNVTLVALAALLIGAGLNILPKMASAWNAHRQNNARQANVGHRATSTKVKTSTSSTVATTTSGGVSNAVQAPAIAVAPVVGGILDLFNPSKKELAMRLVSSAENSSTNWKAQYSYIEDIGDGRGFTAGIVGFCSGTGDMLELVQYYTQVKPSNALAAYLPALKQVNGTDSHSGLGPSFVNAWKAAASDPLFQQAQDHERDRVYFDPAIAQAKSDGLRALGQFMYYDAMVMHGPGDDAASFGGLRAGVVRKVKPPSQGGNEAAYLNAFLDARKALMLTEAAHDDTSRVDTEQRAFLNAGNLDLNAPLTWKTYGDSYNIPTNP
jgi:chitosanase